VGLGQGAAGDDGVGLAVLHALEERAHPDDVELLWLPEPSALLPLLDTPVPVVLVDAVLGARPGEVLVLDPEDLAAKTPKRLSSHGLGVGEAIRLARALAGDRALPESRIVAVTIARPERYARGLSPEVAAAVPNAVDRVLALLSSGLTCGPAPAAKAHGMHTRCARSLPVHESSLARRILTVALERAGAGNKTRILAVRGWIADTESLSRESLAFHFAAHARGTRAAGARLDLRLVHVLARCKGCGQTYGPDHHVLLCPRCGSAEGELLGRTGLGLDALEVE
jgi:hydrogenase nickel incorporation protein HypA/HybF